MKKSAKWSMLISLLSVGLIVGQSLCGYAAVEPVEIQRQQKIEHEDREKRTQEEPTEKASLQKITQPKPIALQLKEALALEQQMDVSKGEALYEELKIKYIEALTLAITGGYDRAGNRANGYGDPDTGRLDTRMVDYYRDFVTGNGDCRTARLVKQYIQILEEQDCQITSRVISFYEELPEQIDAYCQVEEGSLTYWLWKIKISFGNDESWKIEWGKLD